MSTARKQAGTGVTSDTRPEDEDNGAQRKKARSQNLRSPAPELLEAADRQQLLAYTKDMLVGLAVCTQKHNLSFLSYLLGMAVIEASEQLGKTDNS